MLYSDDFNRDDAGTLGAEWTSDDTGITSNQAVTTNDDAYNKNQYLTALPSTDHECQVDVIISDVNATCGPAVRYQDTQNFIWGAAHSDAYATPNSLFIYKVIANNYTLLGSVNNADVNPTLKLVADGNWVYLYANGTVRISVEDAVLPTGTYCGFLIYITGSAADNWYAGDIGQI